MKSSHSQLLHTSKVYPEKDSSSSLNTNRQTVKSANVGNQQKEFIHTHTYIYVYIYHCLPHNLKILSQLLLNLKNMGRGLKKINNRKTQAGVRGPEFQSQLCFYRQIDFVTFFFPDFKCSLVKYRGWKLYYLQSASQFQKGDFIINSRPLERHYRLL